MIASDRARFLDIVLGLAELKGKQLTAPALELWWRSMQDWDLANFQATAVRLVKTCTFMPGPKDFEDACKAAHRTAGETWTLVLEIARSGTWRQYQPADCIDPEDRLMHATVASLGGWSAIGRHPEETLHFLERRFSERFAELRDVAEVRAALPYVADRVLPRRAPQALAPIVERLEWSELPRGRAAVARIHHNPEPAKPTPAILSREQRLANAAKALAAGLDAEFIRKQYGLSVEEVLQASTPASGSESSHDEV